MSTPFTANTTCDVYRNGNAPPAGPDVAGVKVYLSPDFAHPRLAATTAGNPATAYRWTHVALVDLSADIRDGYSPTAPGNDPGPASQDWVYVPDKTGTKFAVLFVERVGWGSGQDFKRVYLQRQTPAWPTGNL